MIGTVRTLRVAFACVEPMTGDGAMGWSVRRDAWMEEDGILDGRWLLEDTLVVALTDRDPLEHVHGKSIDGPARGQVHQRGEDRLSAEVWITPTVEA